MSQDALMKAPLESMTLEQLVRWLARHMGANYIRALAMRLAEYADDEQPTRLYAIRQRGSTATQAQAAHEAASPPASTPWRSPGSP